jgi:ferric-dicitrate binding protein FerR (iron transport regulator)
MSERDNMDLTPEERQLQQSVRDLGEVRANDAFRAKLREQFVTGEFAETAETPTAETPAAETPKIVELPPQRRSRRRFLAVLPAMAAVLAIVIFSGDDPEWKMADVRGIGTVTVNSQTVDVTDSDAVANLIVPSARISVPEGVQLDVVLDGVMVVGVAGPADFTLPDNPDGDEYAYAATVHRGEFRIKTGPKFPGSEVLILTSEGRIEITGTTIAVYKNDEVTCVCVLEGTALIGKDGDHMDAISAGMRKVMFADGSDPAIIPIEPGHKAGLIEFEGYNQDTFE